MDELENRVTAKAATTRGMANRTKVQPTDNPVAKIKPAAVGPTIAPTRPAPIAQPTPVVLISVGYRRAAMAYKPVNPPCTKNINKKMSIKIGSTDTEALP